jgi:hypothetical protein
MPLGIQLRVTSIETSGPEERPVFALPPFGRSVGEGFDA